MEECQKAAEILQKEVGPELKMPVHFSVIMPVYNGAHFLEEAVQSVIDQTCNNWELLIVDDGSTDSSLRIIERWVEKDKRIKAFRHKGNINKGVSASRNLAIRNASGTWISLLDADDTWFPVKLEREAEIINSCTGLTFIYSLAVRSDEYSNIKTGDYYGTGIRGETVSPFRKMISGFITSTSAVTFRKKAFEECGGFNENFLYSEDTLLFHQLFEKGNVYFIDSILGSHRIHRSSVAASCPLEKKVSARYEMYENLLGSVREENLDYVRRALVSPGLKKIFRTYIVYPINKPDVARKFLKRTLTNPALPINHKIWAVVIYFTEYLFSPLKFWWLKSK